MRDEMVENGLRFLQHPNVQSTPLSERVSFLEGKGMTKEEIQEAIDRHQKRGTSDTASLPVQEAIQQQQVPFSMMNAAVPMQMIRNRVRYPAYVRILWTVSSLVGAASILAFLWNFAVQSGYIPWLRPTASLLEASKVQEEKEQEAKKDDAVLAELSKVSSAIQQQTEELAKLSVSLDEKECSLQNKKMLCAQISSSLAEQSTTQAIAEVRAEISTLKTLLLSKSADSVSRVEDNNEETKADPSKTIEVVRTFVNPQQPPNAVSVVASKADRMIKALKKLRTENSLEQLKLAAGILIMYVTNLIENPDVPRYRRIALGNANFKQKMEPLKHHRELLESIGFETVGLNMEWKWHTASKATGAFDENIAILRAVLEAFKSLTYPQSSSTNFFLEEIARESLDKFDLEQGKMTLEATTAQEKLQLEQSSSREISTPAASSSASLDAFMARLEQQTSATNIANCDENMKKEVSLPLVQEDAGEEKTATSFDSTTVCGREPSYPESFKDVMSLIQKGEQGPGIRDIEESLSVDATELLRKETMAGEAITKPWEKINNIG